MALCAGSFSSATLYALISLSISWPSVLHLSLESARETTSVWLTNCKEHREFFLGPSLRGEFWSGGCWWGFPPTRESSPQIAQMAQIVGEEQGGASSFAVTALEDSFWNASATRCQVRSHNSGFKNLKSGRTVVWCPRGLLPICPRRCSFFDRGSSFAEAIEDKLVRWVWIGDRKTRVSLLTAVGLEEERGNQESEDRSKKKGVSISKRRRGD